MSILVVEDDQDISTLLKRGFELEGYEVDCASSGEEAMSKLAAKPYATMILDVMLLRQSSLEVCKSIRKAGSYITVIMLSAGNAVADLIEGLYIGADDYVVKPFEFGELLARVKAHERRSRGTMGLRSGKMEISDGLIFDTKIRKLEAANQSIPLTEKEADLLMLFVENRGKPMSRMDIFNALWAADGSNAINVVDVYVGYLRRKISALGIQAKALVKTVRGTGFTFDPK